MSGLDTLHRTLLRLEPETSHRVAIVAMQLCRLTRAPLHALRRRLVVESPRLTQRLWGRVFPNPVGLAAGYDKDARVVPGMAALGFGFVEVGTVTPMPQRGNPKPRIFRHQEQGSLQNCLGFNNQGAKAMATRLQRQRPFPVPVGVNIGKNRATTAAEARRDYEHLVERLGGLADYLVINISSPNTPGLRDLQRMETLIELVEGCQVRTDRPILVKLAPDLADTEAVEVARAAVQAGASGIVIANTTVDYRLIPGAEPVGGLSGRVLRQRSLEMLRLLAAELDRECLLVSVGGIESAEDVLTRLQAGANLVQIYTALIYQGPRLVGQILRQMLEFMDREGVESVSQLIGRNRQIIPSEPRKQ